MTRFYLDAINILLLTSAISAIEYPVGITNCGVNSWFQSTPKRAVTMNQGTTEIMLALKLADKMVGTAYLDDEIWSELESDYKKVPVLSDTYPTAEKLLSVQPDFIYAAYSSAFATSHVNYTEYFLDTECSLVVNRTNGPRYHCREELNAKGVQTYLQRTACEEVEHRPTDTQTLQTLYSEIWEISNIFNVYEHGRLLIDSIEKHFKDAAAVVATKDKNASPYSVLWLDMWHEETPFVGACCGSINTIIESSGAKNIFDDQAVEEKKNWDRVTWANVTARDPDLIVLIDASWAPAGKFFILK